MFIFCSVVLTIWINLVCKIFNGSKSTSEFPSGTGNCEGDRIREEISKGLLQDIIKAFAWRD
jgi:hypothetical protein